MTEREKQKINARIAQLQKQQLNLKAQVGQHYQAIAEVTIVFDQLQARVEELQDLIKPKSEK